MQILTVEDNSVKVCFQFDKNELLVDFIWSFYVWTALSDYTEFTQKQQERMVFYIIDFISYDYHEDNLFHGDIKPANIFFNETNFQMTTDNGSLLYLGETN